MEELDSNKPEVPFYRCTKDIAVVSASILMYIAFMKFVSKTQIHAMSQYIMFYLLPVVVLSLLVAIIIRSIVRIVLRRKRAEKNEPADLLDRRIAWGSFIFLTIILVLGLTGKHNDAWRQSLIDMIGIFLTPIKFLLEIILIPFWFVLGYSLWFPAVAVIVIAVGVCQRHYWQWLGVSSTILTTLEVYRESLDPYSGGFVITLLTFGFLDLIVFLSIAGPIYFIRRWAPLW